MKNRLNNHKNTKINDFTFAHVDVPKGIFPHTQFPMGLIHSSHIYSIFFSRKMKKSPQLHKTTEKHTRCPIL